MQLSLRLNAVAKMVSQGNRLVDVGCDHGYLPVYLYLNRQIPGAIAMDVRPGPLSRAREHIAQYGLEQYIETRLSDGLEKLLPGEGDTLVIAGMGGPLMERILKDGEQARENFEEMILAPQSDVPHFRRFIGSIGWEIVQEEMILEDGKFYPIMKAVHGTEPVCPLDETKPYTQEEWFGRYLLKGHHPVLKKYLERELGIRKQILEKLKDAEGTSAQMRMKEVEEDKRLIEAALNKYEGI